MRNITVTFVALLLAPAAASAQHPAPTPAPVAIQDVRLSGEAPVQRLETACQYAQESARIGLDVRYGPADSTVRTGDETVSTWRSDGPGRDGSMRAAGIGRIVVVESEGEISITLTPAAAASARIAYASAK